jgi:hypothetical protein
VSHICFLFLFWVGLYHQHYMYEVFSWHFLPCFSLLFYFSVTPHSPKKDRRTRLCHRLTPLINKKTNTRRKQSFENGSTATPWWCHCLFFFNCYPRIPLSSQVHCPLLGRNYLPYENPGRIRGMIFPLSEQKFWTGCILHSGKCHMHHNICTRGDKFIQVKQKSSKQQTTSKP